MAVVHGHEGRAQQGGEVVNRIKYIRLSDGKTATVAIHQPSANTMAAAFNAPVGWGAKEVRITTMASADAYMWSRGFVRAGKRWTKPAVLVLRAAMERKNNAALATR